MLWTIVVILLVLWLHCLSLTHARAQAEPAAALTRMPIKEVTVFKDGHAFVVHQGRAPVDAKGHVVLDRLPTPLLGTFWPYSADREVRETMASIGVWPPSFTRTIASSMLRPCAPATASVP